jgi:DNA helicase II / ATP-dependent DNA helicase PcrA
MNELVLTASNAKLDNQVDIDIAAMLNLDHPRSFFLFAGAGSGKTKTLVNALKHLSTKYKDALSLRGRQVAVITYTNAACDEIVRRIDFDPLFLVSTIHSFAWQQIQSFSSDIRERLRLELKNDIEEIEIEEQKGRSGTKASTTRLMQIDSKQRRLQRLDEITSFTYSPNGDNRERNSLNHSDVIKLFSAFLLTKPLMQRLLVEKFPFLLIDESQDTNKNLIDALLAVQRAHATRFCLGLIGDTMQRIYADGKEKIETFIPQSWAKPEKRLNHRCPKRIVRLINRIRQDADNHVQEASDNAIEGCVRLFVFQAEAINKPEIEAKVRTHMAKLTSDQGWNYPQKCKTLTLEHHMAAKRMGFQSMFDALASVDQFRTGLLDGTLAATRFFTHSVLPLVTAEQNKDKFAAAKIIRERSPLLNKEHLKQAKRPVDQLRLTQSAIDSLMALWSEKSPTCGEILENVCQTTLFEVPDMLRVAIAARGTPTDPLTEEDSQDPLSDSVKAMIEFLQCPFTVIPPYAAYVAGEAEFGTHQGVKGLEFERVMVLMDDSETKGFMFGYEKLLGAKAPTTADFNNLREGKETSVDRTRRLFYVTCSRAKSSLALIAYSVDPEAVKAQMTKNNWFEENEILLEIS